MASGDELSTSGRATDGGSSDGQDYTVNQGECIESIAFAKGFFWKTLWDHPNNSDLNRKRKDPNVLLPGDRVFIPDRQVKKEPGATEQRHRFRLKGVPALLRLVLRNQGEPRANKSYVLTIDGIPYEGATDGDGKLEHAISPGAETAKLRVEGDPDDIILLLRRIDPEDSITGAQSRLSNLGYDITGEDETLGPKTQAALRDFQEENHLEASGELNAATSAKLREVHGC